MVSIPTLNYWDRLCFEINGYIRQLLVVPFLFYSGYGVTLSIVKKGDEYVRNMPRRRMLPTLLNYDVAVLFFLLMNLALDLKLNLSQVLLSFTAWDSIRNSNWYIFCILICCMISWLAYRLAGVSKGMLAAVWAAILLYTAVMYFFKGHWWYDTVYVYGAGTMFTFYQSKIVEYIKFHYILVTVTSTLLFLAFYNAPQYFSVAADISAVFLCVLVLLLTMKVRLKNDILAWSGKLLFPIYISDFRWSHFRLFMVTLGWKNTNTSILSFV